MRPNQRRLAVDSFSMLRLQKAALLTHWLPGLGAIVCQHGRRLIRVATTQPHPSEPLPALCLDPCGFRQLVIRLGHADALDDTQLIDPGAEVWVEYFTSGGTQLGPNGLVRACVTDEMAVLGFASALSIAHAHSVAMAHADDNPHDSCAALDVHFDHDHELGMTLVHRAFETASAAQEQRVLGVLLDLTAVCGAEEVAARFDADEAWG